MGVVADDTWRRKRLHLTVDRDGVVSLWDQPVRDSFELELTDKQVNYIEHNLVLAGHGS